LVLKHKDIPKVDVVAHSQGCINAVIAALEEPDKIRNLVLVNPAGLMGADTVFALALRSAKSNLQEQAKLKRHKWAHARATPGMHESDLNVTKHPAKAYLASALGISRTNIKEALGLLGELGVGISIIHTTEDETFPLQDVEKTIKDSEVDGFYIIPGSHNEVLYYPENVAPTIIKALRTLEARSNIKKER